MATTVPQSKSKKGLSLSSILRYGFLIVAAILILIPLYTVAVGGLKNTGQFLTNPFGIPRPMIWSNYSDVLRASGFWKQLSNSLLVMFATTLIVLACASTSAFVFSRMQFRGREFIATYFTLGLLFPVSVAILPIFILVRRLGLVDTLWGVILPQVAFLLPLSVLILRNFFRGIPRELEDAAYVDGASPFEFFWRILLPLARPGLAAVSVLCMVASWNNFFLPLVTLNSEKHWTLPLGVMQYQGQFGTDWARVSAYVTVSMVPAVIFYLFAERQIITGLTAGAIKG